MHEIADPVHSTSEPGRFWTLANIGEVTPGIMSPMCWSLWEQMELSIREAWSDLGIMRRRDRILPDSADERQTACFYGRHALNVDLTREYMGQIPGASADDFERDICGSVRSDAPPTENSVRRLPAIGAKTPWVMLRNAPALHAMYDRQHAWWKDHVLVERAGDDPVALMRESIARFRYAMRLHVRTRCVLQAAQSGLTGLAGRAGDPELAGRIFAGFGNVTETQLADLLWRVSRGGAALDDFLAEFGFHGPVEGMVWTRSWREDRTPVEATVAAMASRPDGDRPRVREAEAVARRRAAERELLAKLAAPLRPVARFLFDRAGRQVRNLELGKAAYLMGIDGCRAGARRSGRRLVEAGLLDDVEDAFFLTVDEHATPPRGGVRDLVRFRRARRAEYDAITLPMTFHGVPEPVQAAVADPDARVAGIGASGGVVTGRACVVDDPVHADLPDEGEVLVCRVTDPSWAAHFTLAAAVVIDIGSSASHGAIVARELGIPCVINTGNGTSVLRSGDLIRVDGTAGTVEILERATPDAA